ncbi:hypothetical protein VNI00_012454 [Paramarasmius palmivorus]|uniref:Phytocyanin domain-containing protein n=1 Tax=Paramarasmius palmivorus TaxID=297713 RepID=A0AAW0C556_9AGAR
MRFSTATAAVALTYAVAGVLAADIPVKVGDGGSTFTPSSINATSGDVVVFQFVGGNHTATQSTFDNPCTKKGDGVDSGFQSIAQGASQQEWRVPVNGSDPLWFYCAQANHCQQGMVFAVNAPADKTFDAFQSKAKEGNGAMGLTASAVSLLSVAGLALGLAF